MVNRFLYQSKVDYYQNVTNDCSSDQKKLFQVVNKLLNCKAQNKLPTTLGDKELPGKFSQFFTTKVNKIRKSIKNDGLVDSYVTSRAQPSISCLDSLPPTSHPGLNTHQLS